MATESFYEDLIIDTPEALRNLERAIELAEKCGPLVFDEPQWEYDNLELALKIKRRLEQQEKDEEDGGGQASS